MKFSLCMSVAVCATLVCVSLASPVPAGSGLSASQEAELQRALVVYTLLGKTAAGDDAPATMYQTLKNRMKEKGKEVLMEMVRRVFTTEFWTWFKDHGMNMGIDAMEAWIKVKMGHFSPMAITAIEWLRNGGIKHVRSVAHEVFDKMAHPEQATALLLVLAENDIELATTPAPEEHHSSFVDWMAEQAMKGFLKSLIPEDVKKFLDQDGVKQKIEDIKAYLHEHFGDNPMVRSMIEWVRTKGHEILGQMARDMINGKH